MEQGSWIRRMFEEGIALKGKFGPENVFDLSLGNPIMEPPLQFFDELRRVANQPNPGMHRYMPNAGYRETRAAVAGGRGEALGPPKLRRQLQHQEVQGGSAEEERPAGFQWCLYGDAAQPVTYPDAYICGVGVPAHAH